MAIRNEILKRHFEKMGFDDDFFFNYENATDDTMQNMSVLVDYLRVAFEKQLQIAVYTDFDVDGIMSGIIAYAGLTELGFNVRLFKPSPSKGYGFHVSDVDEIMAQFPDVNVILTGDVGISCNDAIDYAKLKGLVVLVTDHHISNQVCNADAAVNPNQMGETYSHPGICGSYVIYKVLQEYCKLYCGPDKSADIYRLQMFAGIATVSDVMPLLYENRQLVRNSVSIMRYFFNYQTVNNTIAPPVYSDAYSRAFIGIKELLKYFTERKKIKTADDITEQFYGFYLVPFLNACKRMAGDMNGIYDIFFSDSVEPLEDYPDMGCVKNAIKYIDGLNEERRELTNYYFESLMTLKESGDDSDPKAVCTSCEVYITEAPAGLCGLLATKLMNISGMPTLVVRLNEDNSLSGSGRCPAWCNLSKSIKRTGINMSLEGHKEAFGVYFASLNDVVSYMVHYRDVIIPEYQEFLKGDKISVKTTAISISDAYDDNCEFRAELDLLTDYLNELELYHPFGKEFPEPKFDFYIEGDYTETMFGKTNEHIKLVTDNGIEIMLFNQALDFEKLKSDYRGKNVKILCHGSFRFDTYNANTTDDFDNISFFTDSVEMIEIGDDVA